MADGVMAEGAMDTGAVRGRLSPALRAALFALAEAASGNQPGRLAVIRLAGLLAAVDGEGALAERLALLGSPSTRGLAVERGWVGRMVAAKRLTPAQFYAAQEIGRAVAEGVFSAAAGLRAVDTTRVVVDGGKFSMGSPGGVAVKSAERAKYERWVTAIRALPFKRSAVRGKGDGSEAGALFRDQLVVRVVVDGVAPSAIDRQYRLRNGRSAEVVLVELERFAKSNF